MTFLNFTNWPNVINFSFTAQKVKFSIKALFSKCDQIHRFLRIWSHLLNKSLMQSFIFCAVFGMFLAWLCQGHLYFGRRRHQTKYLKLRENQLAKSQKLYKDLTPT